ncbi:MAG TPA: hypothetical protein VJ836_07640 [Candidatus Saccharimonadales bacterium]|nr:hypothetical protein [Candidatus Saccharimonadales bacterium]
MSHEQLPPPDDSDPASQYDVLYPTVEQAIGAEPSQYIPTSRGTIDGLSRFRYRARRLPRVDLKEQVELFEIIAANTPRGEGTENEGAAQQALARIVHSYIPLAIVRAWAVHKRTPSLDLDDLVGAANEGLMVAIHKYAQKEEKRAFPDYLEYYLRKYIVQEIDAQLYRKHYINSELREAIKAYREAAAKQASLYDSSRHEIAAAMGVSVSRVLELETLTTPHFFYEGVGEQDNNEPLLDKIYTPERGPESRDDSGKAILIERALTLLPLHTAELLRKHYGLDGPAYSVRELMDIYNVEESSIRGLIYSGQEELRTLIPQLQNGTLDLIAWRANPKHCRRRNVLVFLALVGEDMPLHLTLDELRATAMNRVHNVHAPWILKDVLIRMYGLKDGKPIDGVEVANSLGIPEGSIYYREKQAFQALGVTLPPKKLERPGNKSKT